MKQITTNIKAWALLSAPAVVTPLPVAEKLERPEVLPAVVYKLSTPLSAHAYYITISDIILNQGTPQEIRRPFEIFINTKDVEQQEWVIALTRMISAIFRKGGDISFVVEELLSVHSSRGGYMKRGGKYIPSLVAEIGYVVKRHIENLSAPAPEAVTEIDTSNLELCSKCHSKGVIYADGCKKCIHCGDSKCG